MKVNGNINFTGDFTVQGRPVTGILDDHYELGLILIRGLIGGGYIGGSVWSNITSLKYSTDTWGTLPTNMSFTTNYGAWASSHQYGYIMKGSAANTDKVHYFTDTISTVGNRTNGSYSPSSFQHGVGYETTGVPYGTKAYTCGTGSANYDILTFSTDSFTAASDSGMGTTQHSYAWFDKDYGYHFSSAGNFNKIYPFATETWSTMATVNSPRTLGMPGSQLEKGVNSKKSKAYVAGASGWINNTIFQFRNSITTWTINYGSQTAPNCEQAGTMGQNHGYLAGGYQSTLSQNAHTDKLYYDTDTVVQIADAPRSLSSASPTWGPI